METKEETHIKSVRPHHIIDLVCYRIWTALSKSTNIKRKRNEQNTWMQNKNKPSPSGGIAMYVYYYFRIWIALFKSKASQKGINGK